MSRYDVAVVGMGPVGAAAALLFAEAGLRVVVFERDREVFPLPRAVAFDGEIVRGFQRVGYGEAIDALLQPIREGERAGFVDSRRKWLFGYDAPDFGRNGWQPISFFHQPEVDGFLRDAATAHEETTAYIGYEVDAFDDDGQAVRIRAKAVGGEDVVEVEAAYLVACDGASSPVRRRLGIEWKDLGYDHEWLVVDVEAKAGHTLRHETLQVCDPDRLATYVCVKDPYRRWEWKLNPGETREDMLDPERIASLIEAWTPRGTFELVRSAVYQFHAATAATWRKGRVMLAGDAAHQTPPFLGQGMNAGLRDVINLAWKLPLVLEGLARPSLLDTYEAERQPHAEDLVDWAVALGRLMEHLAAVEAAARAGQPAPPRSEAQTSAGYGQGREAPPLRAGVLMVEQVSDAGSTGYLFAQPIVEDAEGASFRLDERLGRGFALVARAGADLAFDAATRARLERIGVTVASLEGLTPTKGRFDDLFEQAAFAIVRPDRYVFGHTTEALDVGALVAALETRLELV